MFSYSVLTNIYFKDKFKNLFQNSFSMQLNNGVFSQARDFSGLLNHKLSLADFDLHVPEAIGCAGSHFQKLEAEVKDLTAAVENHITFSLISLKADFDQAFEVHNDAHVSHIRITGTFDQKIAVENSLNANPQFTTVFYNIRIKCTLLHYLSADTVARHCYEKNPDAVFNEFCGMVQQLNLRFLISYRHAHISIYRIEMPDELLAPGEIC